MSTAVGAADGEAAPGVEVDYAAVVDPDSFVDLAGAGLGLPSTGREGGGNARTAGPVLLAVAARVGATRLIDNALIELRRPSPGARPGAGTATPPGLRLDG